MESYENQRADVHKILDQADDLELTREARVRLQCVLHYFAHGENASVTSRRFGISRTTFYNWLKKVNLDDPSSIENKSKAPKRVPQPETDESTIALVCAYRTKEALLSKEKISERLQTEHGITISASTVGRIISRHGFYFADSPSHKEKRRVSESRLNSDHQDIKSKDDGSSNDCQKAAVIIIAATASTLLVDAQPAHALEGSEYQLSLAAQNQNAKGLLEGTSYNIKGGTTSDTAQLLQGSVFRITASPVASTSSPPSSPQPGVSSGESSTNSGGGRRTIPTSGYSSPISPSSSKDAKDEHPSAPVIDDKEIPPQQSIPSIPIVDGSINADLVSDTYSQPSQYKDGVQPSIDVSEGAQQEESQLVIPFREYQEAIRFHEAAESLVGISATMLCLWAALTITILVTLSSWKAAYVWLRANSVKSQRNNTTRQRIVISSILAMAIIFTFLWSITHANAATTVPLNHWYQGSLVDSDDNAVTTSVTIRFSYWKSADFVSADLTATGAIDTSASNYVDWYEEHTLTPGSDGSFAVELGSVQPLMDLSTLPVSTLTSLFLQVEVKASGDADSSYDFLDVNSSDSSIDRTSILSMPFASNADFLDQRDVGTGSGSIPLLSSGASLEINGDLTINLDNEERDAVLTFGNSILSETLKFQTSENRFEFSDDLHVAGSLSGSGTLSIQGAVTFGSTIKINTVNYTFPPSDGVSSGWVLKTDAAGTLSWAEASGGMSQAEADARYVNTSGDTMTGSLEVSATASGWIVHAQDSLTSSGTLSVEGNTSLGGALTVPTLNDSRSATSGSILVSRSSDNPSWAIPNGAMSWYIDGVLASGTSQGAEVTMPFDITITSVSLRVKTAPTTQAIIVDINENGSTIFSTKPQIDAAATTGGGSAVLSDTALAGGSVITVDIDQVGSGTTGTSLTVMINGIRKY